MMTAPPSDLRPSGSTASGPSRARHWAARAALLVASLASVATSNSTPTPLAFESPLQHLTLSAEQPTARRVIPVRVQDPARPEEVVWVGLRAPLSARWLPVEPSGAVRPTVRARLVFGRFDASWVESGPLSEVEGRVSSLAALAEGSECELEEECVWNAVLELELLDAVSPGTVEVEWRLAAEVTFDGAPLETPEPELTFELP